MDHEQGGSTVMSPRAVTLGEVAQSLRAAIGEDGQWAAGVTADTLVEADLGIDSLEVAELNVLLRGRFGTGIDLVAFLGTLDIDQIINLTVGDLISYLESATSEDADPLRAADSAGRPRIPGSECRQDGS